MKRKIFLILIVSLLFSKIAFAALFEDNNDYIQKTSKGEINWSKMLIRANGSNEDFINIYIDAAAKATDEEAAEASVNHNLLESIKELAISSSYHVDDAVFIYEDIKKAIDDVMKNAKIISKGRTKGDILEIVKEVEITGELLEVLLPKEEILPEGLGKIFLGKIRYTSIIFDATKTNFVPVLIPYISDDNDKMYFSLNKKNRGMAVQNGAVRYFKSIDAAKKSSFAGEFPYLVQDASLDSYKEDTLVFGYPVLKKVMDDGFYSQIINNCKIIIIVK